MVAKEELSEKQQKELAEILQKSKKLELEKIYKLFEKTGKKKKLIEILDEQISKVRADYIMKHLKSMPSGKREKVLAKFPSLKTIAFS